MSVDIEYYSILDAIELLFSWEGQRLRNYSISEAIPVDGGMSITFRTEIELERDSVLICQRAILEGRKGEREIACLPLLEKVYKLPLETCKKVRSEIISIRLVLESEERDHRKKRLLEEIKEITKLGLVSQTLGGQEFSMKDNSPETPEAVLDTLLNHRLLASGKDG